MDPSAPHEQLNGFMSKGDAVPKGQLRVDTANAIRAARGCVSRLNDVGAVVKPRPRVLARWLRSAATESY